MTSTTKRKVEFFTAGCPCCEEALKLVQSLLCSSCELTVLDMKTDKAAQAKAESYGVRRVPAVAVNGKLAACCEGGLDEATLRAAGIGPAA